VYTLVQEAQRTARTEIRHGMTGREADALARSAIEARGFGDAFGHSLGHGLGLEVHEAPRVSRVNEEPLPEHAVVTIEPVCSALLAARSDQALQGGRPDRGRSLHLLQTLLGRPVLLRHRRLEPIGQRCERAVQDLAQQWQAQRQLLSVGRDLDVNRLGDSQVWARDHVAVARL